MKKYYLFIAFFWGSINIAVAQLKSQVDECFELTSIVFRLAEAQEYVNNQLVDYTNEIDSYFAKYKDHKLITYTKEIRNKQAIGYNAVSSAATLLDIKNGKVAIRPDIKISQISDVDGRWTEESFKTFVNLLNDFYKKTKFRNFYTQHTDLYRLAEDRMDELLKEFNIDWFKTLFRDSIQFPVIIVSPCNGPHNYAFSIPAKNRIKGMAIGCSADENGQPTFNNKIFIITHEFLHNYANPLLNVYWSQIDSAAQVIYPYVKEDMLKNAYGDAKTTMFEWFTNLLSVMYMQDNPIKKGGTPTHQIRNLQNRGFIWMERSILFMKHFRDNWKMFPTIDDYMPQIVEFINYTAANFDQVINEFDNRHPYVVDVFPASGSTIEPNVDTIEIRFSEPMFDAHGMKPIDDKNIIPVPRTVMPSWKDDYTFIYIIDTNKLEKGKTYGFKLNRSFFQSAKTYPMKEDYIYTLKISEE